MQRNVMTFLALPLVCASVLAQSSLAPTSTVEWAAVFRPTVSEIRAEGQCVLRVSGINGNSSQLVASVTLVQAQGKAKILVSQSPLGKQSARGDFTALVPLDDSVKTVVFGEREVELWNASDRACARQ